MKLKYLKEDYVPKEQLEGFPLEVIDKMLQRQFEQGEGLSTIDFEKGCYHVIDWAETAEGKIFWTNVILHKDFDVFFEKYPKEPPLPRVIEVRDGDNQGWYKRVVFMFKNGKAICWKFAETLEDTEDVYDTAWWEDWREIEESRYTPFDFSKGIGDYKYLLGKHIISRDGKYSEVINQIGYNEKRYSEINNVNVDFYYYKFTFEDGTPVGVKSE